MTPNLSTRLPVNGSVGGATKLFSHAWPVPLGTVMAYLITEATPWTHPAVVAVLTGALVQVFIALLRSWFTERRELLSTMRDMLQEQRQYVHNMLLQDREERHELANRANKAEMHLNLVKAGVPVDDLPDIPPLYEKADTPR